MTVDASPHLPLIPRVIGQLGLRGDQADEAYSVGLVAIVEASQSFDANRGPLASWLANNIKWSIRNWLAKERRYSADRLVFDHSNREGTPTEGFRTNASSKNFYLYDGDLENGEPDISIHTEVQEALHAVKTLCTESEQNVLMLGALGYSGKEIAGKLGISQVQVTRLRQRARARLLKFL